MDSLTEIDLPSFTKLKEDLGADFILEIVETYCHDSFDQLQVLQTALEREDYSTFTRAAHSLKSTSLTLGAVAYGNLARELEMLGRAEKLEEAREKYQQLVDACALLHRRLKDLCYG